MRIIFMGTPQLAVPALEKLIESKHEIVAVVTQPDKESGRGRKVSFSPVKETAMAAGLNILQPNSVRKDDVLDELEALQPDLFVVAAYAKLLPPRLLEMGKKGCINIHPSLLPKYRGAAPLRGPILNGDEFTGVTIMKMAEEFDAGDILLQKSFRMDPKETVTTLEPKVSQLGAEMLMEVIDQIEAGTVTATKQDDSQATYYKQIDKEEGRIDFTRPAVEIERMARANDPWPSAFTTMDGKTFKIWLADAVDEDGEPGIVKFADKKSVLIGTGQGCLKPLEVQIEGKKRMTMEEFLRGRKIEQGYEFGK